MLRTDGQMACQTQSDGLFGEDIETILSLIESDSFDEAPGNASMVTETSSQMHTEESEAHSCTERSKTFNTSRELQRHFSSKYNKMIITLLITRLIEISYSLKQGKESNNRFCTRFFLLNHTQHTTKGTKIPLAT